MFPDTWSLHTPCVHVNVSLLDLLAPYWKYLWIRGWIGQDRASQTRQCWVSQFCQWFPAATSSIGHGCAISRACLYIYLYIAPSTRNYQTSNRQEKNKNIRKLVGRNVLLTRVLNVLWVGRYRCRHTMWLCRRRVYSLMWGGSACLPHAVTTMLDVGGDSFVVGDCVYLWIDLFWVQGIFFYVTFCWICWSLFQL